MEKIKLVIIIPVLNCLEFTKITLSTISSKHPYKLILIDNGSTDGTGKYFDHLEGIENIKIIRFKENIGVCPAWNFGIQYAIRKYNSNYFLIANNDIFLHPEAIDVLIKAVDFTKCILTSGMDVSGRVSHPLELLKMKVPKKTRLTEAPEFSCFMLKTETIQKIGYFDEKFYPAYFEDNDYHYRIRLAGLKAVKTNRALYFHYGSRTIKEDEKIKLQSNLGYTINRDYYRQKWGGLPGEEIYKTPFNK